MGLLCRQWSVSNILPNSNSTESPVLRFILNSIVSNCFLLTGMYCGRMKDLLILCPSFFQREGFEEGGQVHLQHTVIEWYHNKFKDGEGHALSPLPFRRQELQYIKFSDGNTNMYLMASKKGSVLFCRWTGTFLLSVSYENFASSWKRLPLSISSFIFVRMASIEEWWSAGIISAFHTADNSLLRRKNRFCKFPCFQLVWGRPTGYSVNVLIGNLSRLLLLGRCRKNCVASMMSVIKWSFFSGYS